MGIRCLNFIRPPYTKLYLDHDMGEEYLLDHVDTHNKPLKNNGYSVLLWMEANPEYQPMEVHLVTSNPSAAVKMESALGSMGYILNIGPKERYWIKVPPTYNK